MYNIYICICIYILYIYVPGGVTLPFGSENSGNCSVSPGTKVDVLYPQIHWPIITFLTQMTALFISLF